MYSPRFANWFGSNAKGVNVESRRIVLAVGAVGAVAGNGGGGAGRICVGRICAGDSSSVLKSILYRVGLPFTNGTNQQMNFSFGQSRKR